MSDRYTAYRRLKIDRPEERILRVTMDNPKRLNAADALMHEELTRIWRDLDADASVSAAIIRGAGDAFSAGGDLDLVEAMTEDFDVLARVWKEARDLVYNISIAASR
jgi:enoyl-CoA hydratase